MNDAARLLRHARRRAGLTRRALAAEAGVAASTVARIERGAVQPRVGTLSRLVRACGMTLEALPGSGSGVERAPIRAMLRLTPAQRLTLAAVEVNAANAGFFTP
jgi:transcriptional regulator with XRE-family HTH domain